MTKTSAYPNVIDRWFTLRLKWHLSKLCVQLSAFLEMSAFQWNNPLYLQEPGATTNNLAKAWFKVPQYLSTEKCNKCKMVIRFIANLLHRCLQKLLCPEQQWKKHSTESGLVLTSWIIMLLLQLNLLTFHTVFFL